MDDELAAALKRYVAATPLGDPHRSPADVGPVDDFPRLPTIARTQHPSQWAAMMRSLARLYEFPGDIVDTLAFEASTYLVQVSRGTL